MNLSIILLLVSLAFLVIVISFVKKSKMDIKLAIFWVTFALFIVLIAIFPEIIIWISKLLKIQVASNAVFLIFIFILYCLSFFAFIKISKQNDDLKKINYDVASLKRELDVVKNRK